MERRRRQDGILYAMNDPDNRKWVQRMCTLSVQPVKSLAELQRIERNHTNFD